jgi:hypothetical protein
MTAHEPLSASELETIRKSRQSPRVARLVVTLDARDREIDELCVPIWTCADCGYHGTGFKDVVYDSPISGREYDVGCPECDSTDCRETVQEVLNEWQEREDEKDAELAALKREAVDLIRDRTNPKVPMIEWDRRARAFVARYREEM